MPPEKPWLDDVLAEAARHPRQHCSLKVESLSRLHRELGAAAVSQWEAVRALRGNTSLLFNTVNNS